MKGVPRRHHQPQRLPFRGGGRSLVVVREGQLFGIASREAATMPELLERDDVLDYVARVEGESLPR